MLPKTLPKFTRNAFEIVFPNNIQFFVDFGRRKRLPQRCRHRFRIGFSNTFCLLDTFLCFAFGMRFRFKKPTKNLSRTTSEPFQKSMSKICRFSTSIFWGLFWPRFWSLFGLQVRRAACSAWRVKPYRIFLHALTYCISFLSGGPQLPSRGQNLRMLGPCWPIFCSWTPLFRSWQLLGHFSGTFATSWSF